MLNDRKYENLHITNTCSNEGKNLPKKLCTSTPPCTDTSTCSFTQLETLSFKYS